MVYLYCFSRLSVYEIVNAFDLYAVHDLRKPSDAFNFKSESMCG